MSDNTQTPQPQHGEFMQFLTETWQTIRPILVRVLAWLWQQAKRAGQALRQYQQRPVSNNRLYTLHLIRYLFWQLVSKWVYLLLALSCCIAGLVFFWDNPFVRTPFYPHYRQGSPIMGVSFLIIGVNLLYHFFVLHNTNKPTDD